MTAPNVDPVTGQVTSDINTSIPTSPSSGSATSETIPAFVKNLNELKEKAPKFYNSMMQGIAWTICSDSKRQMDDYIERMKEEEREAQGG